MQGNSIDLFGEPLKPTYRPCTKCGYHKPLAEFRQGYHTRKNGRTYKRRWNICTPCMNLGMKAYQKTTKGRDAIMRARCKRYGITLADFKRMFAEQNGACALCGLTDMPIDRRTGKKYDLTIDHCHTTGKVRSLLCPKCNNGLGCFRDDPVRLHAAISYLARHS